VSYPVDRVGDVAAAGSVTAASVSWMTQANEIISLIAGLIAIAAGLFAIAVHLKNLRKP
jgi:hypothetical protein